jgi:hypothetical protein
MRSQKRILENLRPRSFESHTLFVSCSEREEVEVIMDEERILE